MKKQTTSLHFGLSFFLLASPLAAQTLVSSLDLSEGNTILQATGAQAISTGGGPATADTRTLYYFADDFGDAVPNLPDFDANNLWPYVYVDSSFSVDSGISATFDTINDGTGDLLTINGNPVYQFANDMSASDYKGNFGPWYFIETDGTATQSAVPEPSAFAIAGGLAALGIVLLRRRTRERDC
jgi:predicted lipoprotein with Yx(FWY)xxD motif